MELVRAPEHGHEVHARGDGAAGLRVPVVAPTDGIFVKEVGQGGGVVDKAAGGDGAAAGGGGGGGCGDGGCRG